MKTFEIFLKNGTVARVNAAKIEWRESSALLQFGQMVLAALDDAGGIVAEFSPGKEHDVIIGFSSSPPVPNHGGSERRTE